ncbi:MAG: hypothetical protein CALGDGBN_01063 [Pseudomonadales bacterium]|nr:hypothetical protein [Pseudomonadales bacterium]
MIIRFACVKSRHAPAVRAGQERPMTNGITDPSRGADGQHG